MDGLEWTRESVLVCRKRLLDGLQHEESHHAAVLETTNASIAVSVVFLTWSVTVANSVVQVPTR